MEPQVPPVPKRKKKKTTDSSPSKSVPDSSAPTSSTLGQDAPDAPSSPKTSPAPPPEAPTAEPAGATSTPPPEGTKLLKPEPFKGKATASGTATSGSQQLALHAGRAAVAAGETATGLLGQITELTRGGHELGHLREYAEKWNRADVSAATRGLGKDWLPAIDPAGPRSIPEASIEALKTQLRTLQDEKEQLIQEHRKALDTQKLVSSGLKDQLIQFGLRHDQELKDTKAAAEAKLNEVLEDSVNSTAVLRAELEEGSKARKAAEDRAAHLEAEQKEYDLLAYAQKKVAERRVQQAFKNPDAPWDPYDHLIALSARVSHMRAVDRNLADIPEVAIQLFKVLWPEEQVPANLTLTSERLKDEVLRTACSWYEDLDLDAFATVRQDAPTDMDPALTAQWKDRAYRIAEYAAVRTFIPPPPGVTDYLSDYEGEEDEDEDAGEDAPPEGPDAGNVPPEAPAA
nr:uncharacterized protein LOC127316106 [Lolium perenne]